MEHPPRRTEAAPNAWPQSPPSPPSLLMASAWVRVAGALMLAAALWLAVGWALK
ncbi:MULTISPECIES: hypothetical protein [unclassified Variovorax]|uniref:hypothetical protein n=1 Tax=unclassified Variovorax TaxID=663243 RepID=UPI0034E97F10